MHVETVVGLQLYSVKDEMDQDYEGTLRKVAEMGYQGVEFFYYGFYKARELKSILNSSNLKPMSTHVGIERMEQNAGMEIEYALELGLKDIVIPRLAQERRKSSDDYKIFAQLLQMLGEYTKSNGLQLHYHNHYYEFDKIDDSCGMDIILSNTSSESLLIELDVFWVHHAGLDPVKYLKSHSNRIKMVHLKDRHRNGSLDSELSPFTEIGSGIIDMQGIISACAFEKIPYLIVEQDGSRCPKMESIKISSDYLKGLGLIKNPQ